MSMVEGFYPATRPNSPAVNRRILLSWNPANMNELLSLMTPEEIEDGLWFIDTCERNWGPADYGKEES